MKKKPYFHLIVNQHRKKRFKGISYTRGMLRFTLLPLPLTMVIVSSSKIENFLDISNK